MRSRRTVLLVAVAAVAGAGAAVAAMDPKETGRIGPEKKLLGNGRKLAPFGKLVTVGQFPTGGALTPGGRYYWTVSSGRGQNDVRIVSVRSGRVLQTLRIPGGSGGIAMSPTEPVAYVSGVSDSRGRPMQATPAGTPGKEGDVVHVFRYSRKTGSAEQTGVLAVPAPSSAPQPQNFPPTNIGQRIAWPDRLAVSPDGKRLLVPLNLSDVAAIVDVGSKGVRYVSTGTYPYGAAILRDGKTGLVSNEGPGTVSVIDLDSGTKRKDIQVGAHLSHPEAIAVDPRADRAYVAIANSDQVAVIDTKRLEVDRTLAVGRDEGLGTAPVDLTVSPDGRHLLVAESGTDSIAVFALPGFASRTGARTRAVAAGERVLEREAERANERAGSAGEEEEEERGQAAPAVTRVAKDWTLVARIPTAQYPTDVEVAPKSANPCGFRRPKTKRRKKHAKRCAKLLYVSGKGLGTGPNPNGPQPSSPDDSDAGINKTQYLPLLNVGSAAIGDYPADKDLPKLTARADRALRPIDPQEAPKDTPVRAGGPIKHVFYIVRENRTYDQILGDDQRGDGDPKLALFGGAITPNAHELARRYPLLDHVFANSEASIDGHFWTSAAKVSDYVHKNWFQNYGGRNRPYDFGVYAITWPGNRFLFDQAERQGISYFNYGEAIAGTIGLFPDKDRTDQDLQEVLTKQLKSDLGAYGCFPNDASVGTDVVFDAVPPTNGQVEVYDSSAPAGAKPGAMSRFDCFRTRFTLQQATNSVPQFNYITLTNDHTNTLSPGARTPRAMIAENDYGLGQFVDLISHSSIWSQSAIFVIEDDSQDGADHVDAHRIPAFVISPYAKKGAVIHTRYDFLSVIRSMELILGMKPLGLFDRLATPMYDVFTADAANPEPYSAIPPNVDLVERNPATGPGARAARMLPKGLDRASQADMDLLLWKSVHGWEAEPPPPGPGAERKDPRVLAP